MKKKAGFSSRPLVKFAVLGLLGLAAQECWHVEIIGGYVVDFVGDAVTRFNFVSIIPSSNSSFMQFIKGILDDRFIETRVREEDRKR